MVCGGKVEYTVSVTRSVSVTVMGPAVTVVVELLGTVVVLVTVGASAARPYTRAGVDRSAMPDSGCRGQYCLSHGADAI